jgi:hypothetical protein
MMLRMQLSGLNFKAAEVALMHVGRLEAIVQIAQTLRVMVAPPSLALSSEIPRLTAHNTSKPMSLAHSISVPTSVVRSLIAQENLCPVSKDPPRRGTMERLRPKGQE